MHVRERGPGTPFLAAAKTLHAGATGADRAALMEEAAIMNALNHKHLVGLVGVVTKGYPLMIIMEYCEHGSLLSFLKKRTGFDALTPQQRAKVALDVASGMKYLTSLGVCARCLALYS